MLRQKKILNKVNKRGEVGIAGQLVVIISVVVGLMLIAGAVTKAYARAQDKEPEVLCRNSIALRASTQFNIDNVAVNAQIKPVPVLCNTVDLKITGKREEITSQVAEKIAKCWQMFGEGRFEETFKGQRVDVVPSLLGTANQPNQCFNCYYLIIDERTIKDVQGKNVPISSEELLQYMVTHHPSWVNDSVNYLKYIQSYGGSGYFANIAPQGIEAGRAYTISFLPKNTDESTINKVTVAGGALIAIASVGAITCVAVTEGLCTPFAVKLVVGTAIAGAKLTVGGAAYTLVQQGGPIKVEDLYKQRLYSSVYLSEGATGQQFCGSGDLAGD